MTKVASDLHTGTISSSGDTSRTAQQQQSSTAALKERAVNTADTRHVNQNQSGVAGIANAGTASSGSRRRVSLNDENVCSGRGESKGLSLEFVHRADAIRKGQSAAANKRTLMTESGCICSPKAIDRYACPSNIPCENSHASLLRD